MAHIGTGKILRAGAIYTAASVLYKGISFFTIPIFIRLLSPEEFGRYNVFISFEAVIFLFSGLTLHASIKNACYDYKEDYDTYIQNCVYVDFFNSILITIFANIICYLWSEQIDLDYLEVNLLTLSGLCGAITSVYGSKLVMSYQAGGYAVMSFISVIASIVLSLLFIFTFFDFDHYLGRIVGVVAGQVVAVVYVISHIFRKGFSPIKIAYWKYGIRISLPIIPHGLSQMILGSANRVMIKYLYSAAQAGIFSFTYTISMVPQALFSSISSVWEPWFFEKMNENDMEQIRRKSNMFCVLISFVFVVMSCITPEIVRLFATKDYLDAIDISIIVLLGCYFATLYNIPCEVEYFHKKTKHIATSTFICAAINVGLNFLLMQYFSYKVAAYVTLFAYFLYFLFHMYMSYHIIGIWVFDLKTMTFVIVGSVSMMVLSLLMINIIIGRLIIMSIVTVFVFKQRKLIMKLIKEVLK